MAILWCGGEDIDFVNRNNAFPTTTAANYRSAYSRGAINVLTSGAGTFDTPNFSSSADVWLTWRGLYAKTISNDNKMMQLLSNSGSRWAAGISGSSNTLYVAKYVSSSWTTLATSSLSWTMNGGVLTKFDTHLVIHATTGSFLLYYNGDVAVSYSGDTRAGAGNVDTTAIAARWEAQSANNGWQGVSEVILSTDDTRTMSLMTLAPSGAGDSTQWTGTFAEIDDTFINDADLISSETGSQDAYFALTNCATGSFAVRAVKVAARMTKGASGISSSYIGVKTNSTAAFSPVQTLSASWDTREYLMTTNPVTSGSWTTSELDALQLAFRSNA